MKTTTVIDYIVERLADEGITDCFGVPGDYAFPVCDAVERVDLIKYAEAFGAPGRMIRTPDEIAPVLKEALDHSGPIIVGVPG